MAPSKATVGKNRPGSGASTAKMTQNPMTAHRTNRKTSTTEKPIFRDLTFSIAGTVVDTGGSILPTDKIVGWIRAHAGVYLQEVNDDTTHLICSIMEYQKNGPQVKKARKLNSAGNRCHIVVFDWLEDCLVPDNKKRRRKETEYTLDATIKRLDSGFKHRKVSRNKFKEFAKTSKELCDSKLHHVYFDGEGFEYSVVLTRVDISNEKVKSEKYLLLIFESNAKPHHYLFGAKLFRSHRPTILHREHCQAKTLDKALHDFKHFFYDKTGILWDNRLTEPKIDGKFVYNPPVSGQPTGSLPDGYAQQDTSSKRSDYAKDSPNSTSAAAEIFNGSELKNGESASEGAIHHSLAGVYSAYGYQPHVLRLQAQQ